MKKLLALLLVGIFASSIPVSVSAQWIQPVPGTWSWVENGEYVTGWKKINNYWYYFDYTGEMFTGWGSTEDGEEWYYFAPTGEMATDWKKIDGLWYYFGTDGIMKTGWQKIKGKWYYLSDANGEMLTGWYKIGDIDYYFYPDGSMAANTIIDGNKIDANGVADTSAWRGNVNISNFNVDAVQSNDEYYDKLTFGVELKNDCDQVVTELTVRVYCYDEFGYPALDYNTGKNYWDLTIKDLNLQPGASTATTDFIGVDNNNIYCYFPAYTYVTYANGKTETIKNTSYIVTDTIVYKGGDPKDKYFPDFPYTS